MSETKGLMEIIEQTPISIRKMESYINKGYLVQRCGLILRLPYIEQLEHYVKEKYDWSKYGIVLNPECDNMGETLIHEACHGMWPALDEEQIDYMTEIYWKFYQPVRKAAVRRVIKELGNRDL